VSLKKRLFYLGDVDVQPWKYGLLMTCLLLWHGLMFAQYNQTKETEICHWNLPSLRDTFLCPGQSIRIKLDSLVGNHQKDTFHFDTLHVLDGQIHRSLSPLKINLSVKNLPMEKIDFRDYSLSRICIDIYTPKASELEVWLVPPSGNENNILELISPNQASPNQDFIKTCFTPTANNSLSSGVSPYTGEFAATGNWNNLLGESLNGNWQIWISDRVAETPPGLVQQVSLVFETKPSYTVKWTSMPGISCDNCKNPIFTPEKTTHFPLQLINRFGCLYRDTLSIDLRDTSFGPRFICEPKGPGLLEIGWTLPVLLSNENFTGQLVQKGKQAMPLNTKGNQTFLLNGLKPKDSIAVRLTLPKIEGVMCQSIDTNYYCIFPPCELNIIEKQRIPISCFGSEDGSLELGFTNGFSPITLTKEGQVIQPKIGQLKAGIHIFKAIDFLDCPATYSATFIEPDIIKPNISLIKPVLCFDKPGAQLKSTPSGGNGGYSYRWSPDGGSSELSNLLKQGNYHLVITDSKSCVGKDSFLLSAPPLISAEVKSTPTICAGSATGALTVKVTGGMAPYQYLWNNGVQTANLVDMLAGAYKLTITDHHRCVHEVITAISQGASIIKIDSSNIIPVSCYGKNDGLARIFVSGGTKPYQMKWNDPFSQVGNVANRLAAGAYQVEIKDSKGCVLQYPVLMTSPALLQMNVQTRDLTCLNKKDGEMEVFPSGGIGPYQFNWSDGPLEKKRINMPAGNYSVTLTDANKCQVTELVHIFNPKNPLKISALQTYKGCFGKKENTVQVQVAGGSPAYFVHWSHGFNGLLSSNLDTIPYLIRVNDAQGCIDSTLIKPSDLPEIKPEISISPPTCFNEQNGIVSLTKIQGRDGLDFSLFRFLWSSGQRTPMVNGLLGDENYALTVTDAKGCIGVTNGYMRNPLPLVITLDGTHPTCHAGKNGKIWMKSIQSEVKGISFAWSAPDQIAALDTIYNVLAGTYQLTVTNTNGCKGSASFQLKEPSPIVSHQIKKGNRCFGYGEGEAEIFVSGGNPAYQILWADGNTSFKRQSLKGGIYKISITDASNCLRVEEVDIYQPEQTQIDFDLDSVSCFRKTDGVLSFAIFGGKGPFEYSFDKSKWQTGNRISNLGAGAYTIFLKDASGCIVDTTLFIPEPPFFNIDIGNEVIKTNGKQKINLAPLLYNGQEPITYLWTLPDSTALSCNRCKNTELTAKRSMDIHLVATDRKGCTARDGLKLLVLQNRNVLIPTAFSPNNDNQNDLLRIHGEDGVKVLAFKIYDRLGNLVYQDADFYTNENHRGWNGTFRQQEVPVGNYEWFCTVEYPDGYKDYLRGQTQLIR
jgi:gliding motility-associated-like protein